MRKVLIANRGEIAVRIARACDDAQLASVAVYADIDADAVHVSAADEAFALGGNSPADTYLNIPKLLDAAAASGADAVHPGYGFLSENADFAQAVLDAGLTWIGPAPEAIRLLGNKITARETAVRAGAPLVAGSDGPVGSAAEARAFAEQHGLPIAIKAAFGGGGRGMKVVRELEEIEEAFDSAVREAVARLWPRRVLRGALPGPARATSRRRSWRTPTGTSSSSGPATARFSAGTRNSSKRPRHRSSRRSRRADLSGVQAVCREAGYSGAGTVEFLVAADGTVAFLEVNTRLQVEHPITEETTGIDLGPGAVPHRRGEQLRITEDPAPRGHSFEFRLNAEDVGRGFLPSPGTIAEFSGPTGPGIRLDSGVLRLVRPAAVRLAAGEADRHRRGPAAALRRARRALAELSITGWPPCCRSTGPCWNPRTSPPRRRWAFTPAGSRPTSPTRFRSPPTPATAPRRPTANAAPSPSRLTASASPSGFRPTC